MSKNCTALTNLEHKQYENIIPKVAASRKGDLFKLTHKSLCLFDPEEEKFISEAVAIEKIKKFSVKNGNKLTIITGNTGTGKSEFCVSLRNGLEESKNIEVLYFHKDMTYGDFYKEIESKYNKYGKEQTDEEKFSDIIKFLNKPKDEKEISRHKQFARLITSQILLTIDEPISDPNSEIIVDSILNGLKKFYTPQEIGDKKQFFDETEFNSTPLLKKYFKSRDKANLICYKTMLESTKAPSLKDLFKKINTHLKRLRINLYIIFEDFTLEDSEAKELYNFMLSDNQNFDINFIIAGTRGNITILKSEDTSRDRALFFTTDTEEEGREYQAFFFKHNNPIEFIEPYLSYYKTLNNALFIEKNQKNELKYEISKNNPFCNQCRQNNEKLYNYCKINIINNKLFPFNKKLLRNIFDGLPTGEKNPRIYSQKIKKLINDYIETGTLPYRNHELAKIEYNNKDLIHYNHLSENENKFLKWYGKDYELFKVFFDKELELKNNISIDGKEKLEDIEEINNETEGFEEKILEESISEKFLKNPEFIKLKNNLHRFKVPKPDMENEIVKEIYSLLHKYIKNLSNKLFKKKENIINKNRTFIEIFSDEPFYFSFNKRKGRNVPQFPIDITNWPEKILTEMISIQYLREKINYTEQSTEQKLIEYEIKSYLISLYQKMISEYNNQKLLTKEQLQYINSSLFNIQLLNEPLNVIKPFFNKNDYRRFIGLIQNKEKLGLNNKILSFCKDTKEIEIIKVVNKKDNPFSVYNQILDFVMQTYSNFDAKKTNFIEEVISCPNNYNKKLFKNQHFTTSLKVKTNNSMKLKELWEEIWTLNSKILQALKKEGKNIVSHIDFWQEIREIYDILTFFNNHKNLLEELNLNNKKSKFLKKLSFEPKYRKEHEILEDLVSTLKKHNDLLFNLFEIEQLHTLTHELLNETPDSIVNELQIEGYPLFILFLIKIRIEKDEDYINMKNFYKHFTSSSFSKTEVINKTTIEKINAIEDLQKDFMKKHKENYFSIDFNDSQISKKPKIAEINNDFEMILENIYNINESINHSSINKNLDSILNRIIKQIIISVNIAMISEIMPQQFEDKNLKKIIEDINEIHIQMKKMFKKSSIKNTDNGQLTLKISVLEKANSDYIDAFLIYATNFQKKLSTLNNLLSLKIDFNLFKETNNKIRKCLDNLNRKILANEEDVSAERIINNFSEDIQNLLHTYEQLKKLWNENEAIMNTGLKNETEKLGKDNKSKEIIQELLFNPSANIEITDISPEILKNLSKLQFKKHLRLKLDFQS